MKILWSLWIAFGLFLTPSYAFHYHVDAGGGISIAQNSAGFFAATDRTSMPSGLGFNLQISGLVGLNSPSGLVRAYFGLEHRLESFSQTGAYHAAQLMYPVLRFETGNLFFGGGVTPMIWKRIGVNGGFVDFNRAHGNIGILGECGYLFPITPEIAFITTGSIQSLRGSGATAILIDGMVGFRFFGGDFHRGARGREQYDGFRYPNGWERSD